MTSDKLPYFLKRLITGRMPNYRKYFEDTKYTKYVKTTNNILEMQQLGLLQNMNSLKHINITIC
jgi:hypothetical protein